MDFQFVELIDSVMWPEGKPLPSGPTVLVINKAGKFLRGHIIDHNVRVDSAGRVRGRIVMMIDGVKKDVDSNDITSIEKTS